MDQQKCNVPHIQQGPNFAKGPNRIHSQIASFIVHGHGTYSILWDENVRKDADFWASMCISVLDQVKKDHYKDGTLPPVLYLQADNATDNKNLTMYSLCELLRDKGVFRKVKYSFLPVGHTHEDVDASFGCLSRALRDRRKTKDSSSDALTIDDMFQSWKENWRSLKGLYYVQVIFVIR